MATGNTVLLADEEVDIERPIAEVRRICGAANDVVRMMMGGNFPAALALCKRFVDDPEVLGAAFCCVYNGSSRKPATRQGLYEGGMFTIIAEAMERFKEHMLVQEMGCRALGAIAVSDSYKTPVGERGVDLICDAMVTHAGAVLVHRAGCRALSIIIKDHDENKAKFLAAANPQGGGIKVSVRGHTRERERERKRGRERVCARSPRRRFRVGRHRQCTYSYGVLHCSNNSEDFHATKPRAKLIIPPASHLRHTSPVGYDLYCPIP